MTKRATITFDVEQLQAATPEQLADLDRTRDALLSVGGQYLWQLDIPRNRVAITADGPHAEVEALTAVAMGIVRP